MKRTVLLASAALFVFLLCALSACGTDTESITVRSADFPDIVKIKSHSFDEKSIISVERNIDTYKRQHDISFGMYGYRVRSNAGTLIIEENDSNTPKEMIALCGSNVVFGVNYGEWGGWVGWQRLSDSDRPFEEIHILCRENLLGFAWIGGSDQLIFTGLAHGNISEGKLRTAVYNKSTKSVEITREYDLGSYPYEWYNDYEAKKVYIICNDKLVVYSFDGEVNEYSCEPLKAFFPNSITKIEDMIYIGNESGVVRFNTKTEEFTWFPIKR